MTKQYIIDQEPWVQEYYEILPKISYANTDTEFRIIQEKLNEFHRRYRYTTRGFWWFTWAVENKAAHSAWNSLQHLLLYRMNEVYDSSGRFGKYWGESK